MRYIFSTFLLVLLCAPVLVHAFSLQPNQICSGGTLIRSESDVQDGGGLGPYTNAGSIGASTCAEITPPGACCSLNVSTNGMGIGGSVIPYTWFNFQVFTNAVLAPKDSYQYGTLANQPGAQGTGGGGRQGKYLAGIQGGGTGGTGTGSASGVTAALVANPTSIFGGEQSLLTWSSTGATACTGNFPTGGATSGSVIVRPEETTEYTITCGAGGTQCTPGQGTTLTNMSGAVHCEGGTIILRDADTLDGASLGGNLQDLLMQAVQDSGTSIPNGACAMLSFKSGNSSGGGYPPNSYWQITVHDGGRIVPGDGGMYGTCRNTWLSQYTCGSMAGIVSSQCSSGGTKQQSASPTTVAHTEGEMFTSAPVKADMQQNGGVAFTETTFVGRTLASDQTTMNRVCSVLHGTGATATQIGSRGYNSCKNNGIIRFDGTTWASVSGCAGAHLSGSFSCIVPAQTTGGGGEGPQSATARATVVVTNNDTDRPLTASCSPIPSVAPVGQTVTWRSTVYGGAKGYSFIWTGTDGLTGTESSIRKVYESTGRKDASLTVRDAAGATVSTICNGQSCTAERCDAGDVPTGVLITDRVQCPAECIYGCINGQCVIPNDAKQSAFIAAAPNLIKKGQQCTISFSALGVSSCKVTGNGVNTTITTKTGTIATTSVQSPALQNSATYTLTCAGPRTLTRSVECKIAPSFQEF